MTRHIRDLALLIKSIVQSSSNSDGSVFYWDGANKAELTKLVDVLSNPDDQERQVIREILKKKRPSSILDVACGPATEFEGYQKYGLSLTYVGLDRSSNMLGIAKRKHSDATFVYGEAEQLPFRTNSFDAVLLKHILEHLPDYKTAVEEALRISRDFTIINFFHRLLPFGNDIPTWNKKGYWDNWYSRSRFHEFLNHLPILGFERITTRGTAYQTAEVYVIKKQQ